MNRNSHPGRTLTPEELRAQVEDTREQLGYTVEALAAKADLRGRAQAKVGRLRDRVGLAGAGARDTAGPQYADEYDDMEPWPPDEMAPQEDAEEEIVWDKRVLAATGGAAVLTAAVLIGRHRYCRRHR
jgi:hypothetical protein